MGYLTRTRWPGMMLALAVVAALAFSAGSIASVGGQEETRFYACALPNGNLNHISVEEPDCPRNATLVSWSQTGPMGPSGEKGDQGDPGAQGEPGADGQDGTDGVDGTDGIDGQDGAPGADGQPGADGEDGDPGLGVGAGSCATGNVVTGIDAHGDLICSSVPATSPALHIKFQGSGVCVWNVVGTGFAPGTTVKLRAKTSSFSSEHVVSSTGDFTSVTIASISSVTIHTYFATDETGNSAHVTVDCSMQF